MNMFRLGASIALAAAVTLAGAQGASSPSSPAKKELVAKVLQLQQGAIESVGNQLALQTSQQILATAGRALERVPADKREAVGKDIQADVRKFYDDIGPTLRSAAVKLGPTTLGAALEERFTEDELRTVIAWLESSANKKLQQVSGEVVPALAQKLIAETRGTIEPKVQALQASIGKKLAAPASAAGAASAPKPATSAPKK